MAGYSLPSTWGLPTPPVWLAAKKVHRMLLNPLPRPNEENVIGVDGLVDKRAQANNEDNSNHKRRGCLEIQDFFKSFQIRCVTSRIQITNGAPKKQSRMNPGAKFTTQRRIVGGPPLPASRFPGLKVFGVPTVGVLQGAGASTALPAANRLVKLSIFAATSSWFVSMARIYAVWEI